MFGGSVLLMVKRCDVLVSEVQCGYPVLSVKGACKKLMPVGLL